VSNKETTIIRRSTRHHLTNEDNFNQAFLTTTTKEIDTQITFITSKEQANIVLALKLRKEGKITTPGVLFKALIKQEVNSLTRRGVFNFI
jgi:hypothetical protein